VEIRKQFPDNDDKPVLHVIDGKANVSRRLPEKIVNIEMG
jgi:hypothetical protein